MFGNNFNPYATNPYAVQYQPHTQQMPQNQSFVANPNNGIIWVQGTPGAKSFIVAPGNTVQLMDSERNLFYLKTCDNSGMPSLRTFEYKEVFSDTSTKRDTAPNSDIQFDPSNYITRDEFKAEIAKLAPKSNTRDGGDE